MYVTIKLDDKGYKIHSISEGDKKIVMEGDYFVMLWNVVNTRCGANMTLKEATELMKKGEEEREEERRLVSKFENEHRDEINETFGLIEFIDEKYLEKSYPKIFDFGPGRLGIHFEDKLVLTEYSYDSPRNQYSQLNYFRNVIRSYWGLDEEAEKHFEKVKSFMDKLLDELEIEDIRAIREKKLVKFPCRLEISVF